MHSPSINPESAAATSPASQDESEGLGGRSVSLGAAVATARGQMQMTDDPVYPLQQRAIRLHGQSGLQQPPLYQESPPPYSESMADQALTPINFEKTEAGRFLQYLGLGSESSEQSVFTMSSSFIDGSSIGPTVQRARADSSLCDRPGIAAAADTLSININGSQRSQGLGVFAFMIGQASSQEFNVHANINTTEHEELYNNLAQCLLENKYATIHQENDTTLICSHPEKESILTLNLLPSELPTWPEDVIFMGKSAHSVMPRFAQENRSMDENAIRFATNERRIEDWTTLGLQNPQKLADDLGFGGNYRAIQSLDQSDHAIIPNTTRVFSSSGAEGQFLREVQNKMSIPFSIEGGNFLSNGAEAGNRVILIGIDTIAANQVYMSSIYNYEFSFSDAKAFIERGLDLTEGDKLLFLEQPTFHLDMSMMFVGPEEVVLSDTKAFEQTYHPRSYNPFSQKTPPDIVHDKALLEDNIENVLVENGLAVHRKAWVSPREHASNCINGELVKTPNSDRVTFLTCSPIGFSGSYSDALQQDVTNFFIERDISVGFLPIEDSADLLRSGGGLGCAVNALQS